MKSFTLKSKILPAAMVLGFVVTSATSALARAEYYFSYNGANFIYGSMGACIAEAGSPGNCKVFGNYCGRKYASSQNKKNLARLLWNEGKTVQIKRRSDNKKICRVTP